MPDPPSIMFAFLIFVMPMVFSPVDVIEERPYRDLGVRFLPATPPPIMTPSACLAAKRRLLRSVRAGLGVALVGMKLLQGVPQRDGTRPQANASKHRRGQLQSRGKLIKQLEEEVREDI